ncbi:MAG: peptide deformylase [Proteobacteria bacterium]|nr:peptide deformylase [Pseudomonadota bacterium]
MAVLELLIYPNPLLKKKTEKVEKIDSAVKKLIRDMAETMYFHKGVGLAAPQVGVSKQIITIDAGKGLICLINPTLVSKEGEMQIEEGCLSCPEVSLSVTRCRKVVVKGLDPEGKEVMIEAEELLARIFQHEIDHLEGVLIIDRVSPLKRELIKKKLKKKSAPKE